MADSTNTVLENVNNNSSNTISVKEYDVTVIVDKFSTSPKPSEVFYNKEVALNRALITTALAAYVTSGWSVFEPVQCLEGIGTSGIAGLQWKKHVDQGIIVTTNAIHENAFERIKENVSLNSLDIQIMNKDTCILLHEQPYNFISLDCHTGAVHYLDAAFKSLTKHGILAITTTDDAALQGLTPELALRNYGGVITRTFYAKELGIRLFVAEMARVAAKYNKGLHVLCSLLHKSSFTVLVTVKKSPTHANESVKLIRRLVHCKMCEDRAFYPQTNYPLESPSSLLSCNCSTQLPGKITMELGPIWSGSLFNELFLILMINQNKTFPWKARMEAVLDQLLAEAKCSSNPKVLRNVGMKCNNKLLDEDVEKPAKKQKTDNQPALKDMNVNESTNKSFITKEDKIKLIKEMAHQKDVAPAFYFNLHHHSPKGPQLLRTEVVIQMLQRAGFRASRTHFDPEAVKTNASLFKFNALLTDCSKP